MRCTIHVIKRHILRAFENQCKTSKVLKTGRNLVDFESLPKIRKAHFTPTP